MKSNPLATLTLFGIVATTASLATLGCATDPNKQVRAADAAHTADLRDVAKDRSKLEAKEETDRAAADSDHQKDESSLDKKAADNTSKFDKDRDVAMANVVEARRSYRASATARLEQVDARTTVLENKRLAKKVVEPGIAGLRSRCATVKSSVAGLDTVSDASWFATKTSVDETLAQLEKDVHAIELRL